MNLFLTSTSLPSTMFVRITKRNLRTTGGATVGMAKQGSNPTGYFGKLVGVLMNRFLTGVYARYIDIQLPPDNSVILDVGCGGGKFIQYLSGKNPTYQLIGIDHSPAMVGLSRKVNRLGVGAQQVRILQAPVTAIPIDSNTVDVVTAFETVQFWPDIGEAFSEILRVLKRGGTFLIMNRYPPEGSSWWKRAKIKNDREYATQLESAGFSRIETDLTYRKGWIVVKALK